MDEKIEAFVELGFSSGISFGHRSMVRTEFMKFLRLAYLLDFIVVDSLIGNGVEKLVLVKQNTGEVGSVGLYSSFLVVNKES